MHRSRFLIALATLVVALFVFAALATAGSRGPATVTSSRHDTAVREATPSTAIATATAPLRRVVALDLHIGDLVGSQSLAVTFLIGIVAGLSFELLLLGAGLNRRGRAPPFARAYA